MPGKKKSEPRAKAPSEKKPTKSPKPKAPAAKAASTVKAPRAAKAKAPAVVKAASAAKAAPAAKAAGKPAPTRARKALSGARPIPSGKFPRQGETRMMAFIRDPQCVFTYWEVTPQRVDEIKKELMAEYKGSEMVLRVFRVNPGGQVDLIQEIRVEPGEMNRYLNLPPEGGVFFIEVVQRAKSGKVAVYTRSNTVAVGPGAAWAAAAQGSSSWAIPQGIRDYFADEWGPEGAAFPGRGLSSAETQARSRGKYAASHAG